MVSSFDGHRITLTLGETSFSLFGTMRLLLITIWGALALGAQTNEIGKAQYQARCVGCHGEDGSGGGHGPGIVDVGRPRGAITTGAAPGSLKACAI